MVPRKSRRVHTWLKHHLLAIICIGVVAAAAVAFLVWQSIATDSLIAKTDARTQQNQEEATKIAIEAQKKKAQLEAEEKARQEAVAKEAAEQAKTGSVAGDSKACNTATTHIDPASIDVIVNKKHCIQPLTYVPSNLVTSNGATLSAQAIDSFNKLYAAAAAAGQPFYITSSYRSYATQIATYNRWVSISGAAGADTYSARPGYSEHQTGFAFDVAASGCTLDCFGSTKQYQWFQQNAAQYGFIQRYYAGYEAITGYKAEEWHYRYVGAQVAMDMQSKGIKTLEEYWNISGGDY